MWSCSGFHPGGRVTSLSTFHPALPAMPVFTMGECHPLVVDGPARLTNRFPPRRNSGVVLRFPAKVLVYGIIFFTTQSSPHNPKLSLFSNNPKLPPAQQRPRQLPIERPPVGKLSTEKRNLLTFWQPYQLCRSSVWESAIP
jgi:hypothetical protein